MSGTSPLITSWYWDVKALYGLDVVVHIALASAKISWNATVAVLRLPRLHRNVRVMDAQAVGYSGSLA
jgi:hypothetical protein